MRYGRMLALAAVGMLTACHGDSNSSALLHPLSSKPAPRAPAQPKKGPTPAELTSGMVEAVRLGKASAPIDVKFDVGDKPVVGESLDVAIALLPQVAAQSVAVQVSTSDGLKLPDGFAPEPPQPADPSQVYRQTIELTPTQEGVQLVNLNITVNHDETSETASYAVPLIVSTAAGTTAPAAAPPVKGGPAPSAKH